MAKKTKTQLDKDWERKASERYSFLKSLPEYEDLIKKLSSGQDATKELKNFVNDYGPIDPCLEDIPLEEVVLLGDASIGINIEEEKEEKEQEEKKENLVTVFTNAWIAEPIKWASSRSIIRGKGWKGRDKINWNVYLDDEGLLTFAVRKEIPRQIKAAIESWLEILEENKVITFNPKGDPSVEIVGCLWPKEHGGVLIRFNPFAPEDTVLMKIIQTLKSHPKEFSFPRKDPFRPERMKTLRLRKEGKSLREIAAESWPVQFRKAEKKISRRRKITEEDKNGFKEYIDQLQRQGRKYSQALKEAERKFGFSDNSNKKRKKYKNPLRIKVIRLLKS